MSEIRSRYPFLAMANLLGGGCLVVALSMTSLLIREVTTERVVHHLEVGEHEAVAAH